MPKFSELFESKSRRFDKAVRTMDHREELYSDRHGWANRKSIFPGDRLAVKISRLWEPCTAVVRGPDQVIEVVFDAGQRVALHDGFDDVLSNIRHLPMMEDPLDPGETRDKRYAAWNSLTDTEQCECLLHIYRHHGDNGLLTFKALFLDQEEKSELEYPFGLFRDRLCYYLGGQQEPVPSDWMLNPEERIYMWTSTLEDLIKQHDAFTPAAQWNAMLDQLNEIELERTESKGDYRSWEVAEREYENDLIRDLERDGIATSNPDALELLGAEIKEDSPSFNQLDQLETEVLRASRPRRRERKPDLGIGRSIGL